MGKSWKQTIWAVIYTVFIMLLITPLNVIALSLLLVPLLILFITQDIKRFGMYVVVLCAVPFLVLGSLGVLTLLITVFFAIPSVVMGTLYRQSKAAHAVITAGILTLLAEFVIGFAVSGFMGVNISREFTLLVQTAVNSVPATYQAMLPQGYAEDLAKLMIQMIPLYMILSSFYFVIIAHVLTRKILSRQNIVLSKMKPIKDWMLPKSLVIYYVIALVLNMFVPTEQDTTLSVILVNLIPLLNIAFGVQAFSFLCFVTDLKKWNKTVVIIGLAAILLLPPLSLLGVFDTALPIRQRLKN